MNNTIKHYEIGNATDVGKVRKVNEDYYGKKDTINGDIVLVCDGMGGHAGGEKASRLAVDSIINYLNEKKYQIPLNALSDSIIYANKVILDYASQHPELKGMGSTCVALLIKNDYCYYAHVGDSRIYVYSDGNLRQLTKDHSFVQSLVDAGAITEIEAESHPRKNEITNALGLERMQPPSLCDEPYVPHKDDIILLCSDGLSGMVRNDQIKEVLRSNSSLYDKSKELVEQANHAGGNDNVTVQIVKFTGGVAVKKRGVVRKKIVRTTVSLTGIMLLLTAVGFMASQSEYGPIISKKITDLRNDLSGQNNKHAAIVADKSQKNKSSKPTESKSITSPYQSRVAVEGEVLAEKKVEYIGPTYNSRHQVGDVRSSRKKKKGANNTTAQDLTVSDPTMPNVQGENPLYGTDKQKHSVPDGVNMGTLSKEAQSGSQELSTPEGHNNNHDD